MSADCPKVAVIIPNWNTRRWLPGCLDGLRAQTFNDFQIILVDNGSTDDSLDFVRHHHPDIEILAFQENRGFAVAVNAGIHYTHSEYVALLNVDTMPQSTWLAELVKIMDQSSEDVGCLASKMLSMDNPKVIDDAGNTLSWYGIACKRGYGQSAENYAWVEEIFSVSGGASLYRRSFLEDVGSFDESFVSYLEDVDLGLRGRIFGYRYLYVPTASVLHQWGGAKIPRPYYVLLTTRNRLALLLKNIPGPLLLKHFHTLLYGQFYYLLTYKKPFYSVAGIAAFLRSLPQILADRQSIQRKKRISNQVLDLLITQEFSEPGLKIIIINKLRNIWRTKGY